MDQKTNTATVAAVMCQEVTFVTAFNSDRVDLRCGGSPILGPYVWVRVDEVESFIAKVQEYLKAQGKSHQVLNVVHGKQELVDVSEIKAGDAKVDEFCRYLDKEL